MDLIYKEIGDLEAQSLISNRKSERLYFITEYYYPKIKFRGYQARGTGLTEPIKYGSNVKIGMFGKEKATPWNVVSAPNEYYQHKWFVREPFFFPCPKPPIINDKKAAIGADIGNSKDFTIISEYENGVLKNERLIRNEEEINEQRHEA